MSGTTRSWTFGSPKLRTFAVALLATWTALFVELGVTGAVHRATVASTWELYVGACFLLPTALLAAVPVALLSVVLFGCLRGGSREGRAVVTVLVGTLAGAVTAFVTTGRHFAGVLPRVGATGFVALAMGAVAFLFAPLVARLLRERPGLVATVALVKGVGLEALNGFVLVRLYPAFHAGLAVCSLMLAPFVSLPMVSSAPRAAADRRPGLTLLLATVVVVFLSAAFVQPAAERLSRFDNFRLIYADGAPMLGEAVRLAAMIAPPPPIEATDPCLLDPAACVNEGSHRGISVGPNFEGRDIVLLSIDALRADHVGAYGYARKTTPNIDALAQDAAVFEQAYCPTPHTSYSVTSLMTGKYMRPLLLQGAGLDSETLATFLRRYGYRTAAFYPPAVFFIDQARFQPFEQSHYGFEYGKVEFMEGEGRVAQIADYVRDLPSAQRLLLWVHLFGPHEPYEAHAEHPFGNRDVDRYDSEIATADGTVGAIVDLVRKARPKAVVIVTADHGEEFGEHGGRYHGTTVYEEQVRVPLVISAPGAVPARRIATVVQTIDVLPTLLSALSIPKGPRIRGRDLGPLLLGAGAGAGAGADDPGLAFSETEENALLAKGTHRLVCARKLGACRLFDVQRDALEREDLRGTQEALFKTMRDELSALEASHGRFELLGERAETGKGYPPAIRRAIAGDTDAAPDLAALLDDADRDIRRKAAELLFSCHRADTAPALRLALGRDEDPDVRKWCALALTRLGQTAPLVTDLLQGTDTRFRRFAALALAESGDVHGEAVLIDWWQHGGTDDYERALELLGAFTRLKAKDAVWPLLQSLKNVRLRPHVAQALAAIGDDVARGPLVQALLDERYQTARVAITDALVALGAKEELARPLIRFLGVPDPIPGGVGSAQRARILDLIGGPDDKTLRSLSTQSNVGALVRLVIPKAGNGTGVRVIVRARARGRSGEVRVGRRLEALQYDSKGSAINSRQAPKIHDRDYVSLAVPEGPNASEVSATLPASVLGVSGKAAAGRAIELVVFAEQHVTVEALVVVPLADELPPPPPEPWKPAPGARPDRDPDP